MASIKHSPNGARDSKRRGRRSTHQPTSHQEASTRRRIDHRKRHQSEAPASALQAGVDRDQSKDRHLEGSHEAK